MTRPPLELLDLLIRANAAAQNPGEEHEDLAGQFAQVMADPVTGEQLRALRAQAEAEGKYRLMVAAWVAAEDCLRELDERGTHADWEAGNERLCAAEAAMYAAFTPDQARAALAQAEAEREPEPMPAELAPMFRAVIQAGPATWQVTEAATAEQHGKAVAQMVRDTAERHGLGDEPRALHWLSVGDDASLAFVGTSPNSPHLARALGGAWNDLVQVAPELLARCAQADAGGEQ